MPTTQKQIYAVFLISVFGLLLNTQVSAQLSKRANVSRAIFSTAIEDREPVNQVLILANTTNTVYFFTDLRHLENQNVIHRWEYEGKVVTSKTFKVGGPRWRVYSKKFIPSENVGTWTVVVTTEDGLPLKASMFKYVDGDNSRNAILPIK